MECDCDSKKGRVGVDVPDATWAEAPGFHGILISNTGQWWCAPSKFDPPIKSPVLFFEKGLLPVVPPLPPNVGLDMVLKTMVISVENRTQPGVIKFFLTQSPPHFEECDWDQGHSCNQIKPLLPAQSEELFLLKNNGTNVGERLVNQHLYKALKGSDFPVLDIIHMSEFRADAHPSSSDHIQIPAEVSSTIDETEFQISLVNAPRVFLLVSALIESLAFMHAKKRKSSFSKPSVHNVQPLLTRTLLFSLEDKVLVPESAKIQIEASTVVELQDESEMSCGPTCAEVELLKEENRESSEVDTSSENLQRMEEVAFTIDETDFQVSMVNAVQVVWLVSALIGPTWLISAKKRKSLATEPSIPDVKPLLTKSLLFSMEEKVLISESTELQIEPFTVVELPDESELSSGPTCVEVESPKEENHVSSEVDTSSVNVQRIEVAFTIDETEFQVAMVNVLGVVSLVLALIGSMAFIYATKRKSSVAKPSIPAVQPLLSKKLDATAFVVPGTTEYDLAKNPCLSEMSSFQKSISYQGKGLKPPDEAKSQEVEKVLISLSAEVQAEASTVVELQDESEISSGPTRAGVESLKQENHVRSEVDTLSENMQSLEEVASTVDETEFQVSMVNVLGVVLLILALIGSIALVYAKERKSSASEPSVPAFQPLLSKKLDTTTLVVLGTTEYNFEERPWYWNWIAIPCPEMSSFQKSTYYRANGLKHSKEAKQRNIGCFQADSKTKSNLSIEERTALISESAQAEASTVMELQDESDMSSGATGVLPNAGSLCNN